MAQGGGNEKKAAAGLSGAQRAREQANQNENKRRAKGLAITLRSAGKNLQAIADQLNTAGFKTAGGKAFDATRVRRLCLEGQEVLWRNSSR